MESCYSVHLELQSLQADGISQQVWTHLGQLVHLQSERGQVGQALEGLRVDGSYSVVDQVNMAHLLGRNEQLLVNLLQFPTLKEKGAKVATATKEVLGQLSGLQKVA